MLTFDATIPIDNITKGSDNDEKKAYIELEFFNDEGFIKAEIINENLNTVILLKFTAYQHLVQACKRFNTDHPHAKLK